MGISVNVADHLEKARHGLDVAVDIPQIVNDMMSGRMSDAQIAAWLMAKAVNGISLAETTALIRAYVDSGNRIDFDCVEGEVLDKHSTGGVGDKTTIAVLPIVVAAGGRMAKSSGRALGFAGGTIDKLEAGFPGIDLTPSSDLIRGLVATVGGVFTSQTSEIAPADARTYTIRDTCGTVDVPELIIASIISKKIAGGAGAVLLDVKFGEGSIVGAEADARDLADRLCTAARAQGLRAAADINSMEQPLGEFIGARLEANEAVALLRDGGGEERLQATCTRLAAKLLVLGGISSSEADAARRVEKSLQSGAAFRKLREIVVAQGGNCKLLDSGIDLEVEYRVERVRATKSGVIGSISPRPLGEIVEFARADSATGAVVGIQIRVKIGSPVSPGDELARVFTTGRGELDPVISKKVAGAFGYLGK